MLELIVNFGRFVCYPTWTSSVITRSTVFWLYFLLTVTDFTMADGEENPATSGSKRKIDQVIESEIIEQEDSSSSSDEEDLFLPHAREILAEVKNTI